MKAKGLTFVIVVCAATAIAHAQQTITLEEALLRARTRAAKILSAQDRIAEARGRLIGASLLLPENPTIAGSVGPRHSQTGDRTDFEVSVSQSLELGGRRSSRIAGAIAGIDRETATARDVSRRLLLEVSIAFTRGLAAKYRAG